MSPPRHIKLSYKLIFTTKSVYWCLKRVLTIGTGEIMARQILEQELTPIERQIATSPQGISISELEAALTSVGIIINRRTLLRRLTVLMEQNRIIATGALKGRLYLPPSAMVVDRSSNQESIIPLSSSGNEIRHYVSQPIQRREPVGYHRDFLLVYS